MPVYVDIFDEVLENALLVFRYAAGQRHQTYEFLVELEKELVSLLAAEAVTERQRRRVETFLQQTGKVIDRKYREIFKSFEYEQLAKYVANDMRYGIGVALGIDALYLPTDHYFKSLNSDVMLFGAPTADWWRGQSEDLQFKFSQQVRMGLQSGETNQQIINRIVGKGGEIGIMDGARKNAATLVQTSVQNVANDARRETFKANTDVITGIQQVSTLDSHTSLVCIAYSECQWDMDFKPIGKKKKPYNNGVPRHFNCRSVEVPITKTFKEMGLNIPEFKMTTRASDEGPVSADLTFDGFLKRKPQSYQDEMLGKGRADLWRAGKITLKDLVDGNGRPLTLSELKAKRR